MFIPDGILVIDKACNILLVNYAMLGYFSVRTSIELKEELDQIFVGEQKLLQYLQNETKIEVNKIEWISKRRENNGEIIISARDISSLLGALHHTHELVNL
jgi:hypothetical protein